jgi:hypothetical protein
VLPSTEPQAGQSEASRIDVIASQPEASTWRWNSKLSIELATSVKMFKRLFGEVREITVQLNQQYSLFRACIHAASELLPSPTVTQADPRLTDHSPERRQRCHHRLPQAGRLLIDTRCHIPEAAPSERAEPGDRRSSLGCSRWLANTTHRLRAGCAGGATYR